MLESYFVKPSTADRVRCSWIAPEVERYVGWLAERGCAAKCVRARVPLLVAFGDSPGRVVPGASRSCPSRSRRSSPGGSPSVLILAAPLTAG